MEFYQWLVPLLGLFYCVRAIRQYRNNTRLFRGTILWICFWIGISLLAIMPDTVSFNLAKILGFKDHINTVIFLALGFLFLFNMYFTMTIEKLEKQMTELVRKQALENQKLKKRLNEYEAIERKNASVNSPERPH